MTERDGNIGGIGIGKRENLKPTPADHAEVMRQRLEAIRITPEALSGYMSDLMSRFSVGKSDDGSHYVTRVTDVEFDSAMLGVFLAYEVNVSPLEVTLYMTDEDGSRVLVTERKDYDRKVMKQSTDIIDGAGRALTDPGELAQVRELLDSIESSFVRDVTEKADSVNFRELMGDALRVRINAAQARLRSLEESMQSLETGEPVSVRIALASGWESSGEKSISNDYVNMTLPEAIRLACDEFKHANSRSDVQASIVISLLLETDETVLIPQEVYYPYFRSLSQGSYEEMAIKAQLDKPQA